MAWLGLLLGIVAAGTLVPRLVATLERVGARRPNHEGTELPVPAGVAVLVPGLVALAVLTVFTPLLSWFWLRTSGGLMPVWLPGVPASLSELPADVDVPATASAWTAVLIPVGALVLFPVIAAAAGLADDLLGGAERGLRGHGEAARGGRLSSGAIKVLLIGGGALMVASTLTPGIVQEPVRTVLLAALLALSANLVNQLDLRPGRAVKGTGVMLLAAVVVTVLGAGTLGDLLPGLRTSEVGADAVGAAGRAGAALGLLLALGPWLPAIVVVGVLDLRGRVMLGDTGANLLGAVGGLALAFALLTVGDGVRTADLGLGIAVGVLLALTIVGEVWSLTRIIERTPVLRQLDALGRKKASSG